MINDFKDICHIGPKKAKVDFVVEKEWNKPVEIGFNIIKDFTISERKLNRITSENELFKKKNEELKEEINNLKTSKSWRMTKILRKISSKFYNIGIIKLGG